MNDAKLVAVVMGTSEGLVRELETLDDLGLLGRTCVFVPPLDDEKIAERLSVLSRDTRLSGIWAVSAEDEEWRRHVVALTNNVVLIASKRRASAYRAVAAYLGRRAAHKTSS